MWLWILGIFVLCLLFQGIKILGEKQNVRLKTLNEKLKEIQDQINKSKREIERYTSIGESIKRFHNQVLPPWSSGLDPQSTTVSEHTNEFENEITGHRVNVWIYSMPPPIQEPIRIVVAGHANDPVCRKVSAALSNVYYRKDQIDEEDFFVTGAGLLINNQLPTTEEDFIKYMKAKDKGEFPPVVELIQQLPIEEKITGLVTVHNRTISEYNSIVEQIQGKIRQIFESGQAGVFGDNSPDDKGMLVAIPFYKYQDSGLTPISFKIRESDFDCQEFRKLKERHKQAQIQAMKNEVKTRNRRYKEWLEKDKDMQKSLLRMSSFDKITQKITISGVRDYQKAEVIETISEQISIQEYLDKHLPVLIEELAILKSSKKFKFPNFFIIFF